MASILRRGKRYLVRWRDPDGVQRVRTAPDYDTARRLSVDVERTVALGHRWEPADARAIPALLELGTDAEGRPVVTGGLFHAYLSQLVHRVAPGTYRHYDRSLRRFVQWLAARHPGRRRLTCDLLTRDALDGWFGHLVTVPPPPSSHRNGRREALHPLGVAAARLAVDALMSAWIWAHDSDEFGSAVGRPRRPELPLPVGASAAAPTWAQMDAVIAAAWRASATARTRVGADGWAWRARALTLARCTGLRASQVMALRWDDLELDAAAPRLYLRGSLGKSQAERRGREVPLAPFLAELLRSWIPRPGEYVIRIAHTRARRDGTPSEGYRALEAVHLIPLWQAARVGGAADGTGGTVIPPRVYGAVGDRRKGQAVHAFRKGFKTGLLRAGVEPRVRDHLVGHHVGGVDGHYLDLWEDLVIAVGRIPPLAADARQPAEPAPKVVAFPGRRRT